MEVHRIALIERVDVASRRDLNVRVCKNELTNVIVKCKAIHTRTSGQHNIGR